MVDSQQTRILPDELRTTVSLAPGTILRERYRLDSELGRGGMGTVYRATDETLHREVAIKVLNAELNDPEIAKRFRAEAITVARLNHPGIATIYELFQHDGQWLMVMEFVRGETLEHLVERMGALSPQRAAELCMQSLAALAHAHSMGVVHRDLKPANLMITETGSVKIMDFGIARVAGTEHLTNAGYMMGTPAYMAPEQVMGHEIDARADLYAMGVVFYRLTTARLPFRGDTPFAMAQSQVNDMPTPIGLMRTDLPTWVEQVIARALAKAPELRFQSAVEFHEALARCLAGLSMPQTLPGYSSAAATAAVITSPAAPTPIGTKSSHFQTAAPDAPTGYEPQPSVNTSAQPTGTHPEPVQPAATKPAIPVAIGVAALVITLAGVGGWMMMRSRSQLPANAPATPASQAGEPANNPSPSSPSAPATALQPGGTDSRGTSPTLPGAPPATSPDAGARGSAAGAARTAQPSAATPAPTGTLPTPEPSETQVVFPDVKVLMISGKRAQDQDALLSFVGGQMTVLNKEGGTIITATPYKAIERATYIRARNPKWDPSLFSPPENLDMPGILPTARHWLVLQSRTAYLILQLNGSTWQKVLETVEGRTGLKVDRGRDFFPQVSTVRGQTSPARSVP